MFIVQNENLFSTNMEYHNTDTRQRNNSYLPQAKLTLYQKRAYDSVIKIFNHLYPGRFRMSMMTWKNLKLP